MLIAKVLSVTDCASSAEAVRFGVTLGLTGKYAEPAEMQRRGYTLWQNDVNERGGILGRPVEVVVVDDQSNGESAKEIYLEFIKTRKLDLLFGPYSSEVAEAVAPIVDEHGYPTLLAGASSDRIWQQGYRNLFGLFTPASRYAAEMLGLAVIHELQRVAIIHANDPFSNDVALGANRWAHAAGRSVVLLEQFAKGTHDLRYLATAAKDVRAEIMVVGGHFDEAVDARRALSKLGWYPRAYFATIGPTLQAYADILKREAEFTFAPSLWEPVRNLEFPGSRQFIDAFENAYKTLPTYHAVNAYAAGQVIEAATKAAGALDRDRIREALLGLDIHIAIGRFRVDRFGVPVKHRALIIQWLSGKKEIVWPEEHRTALPVFKGSSR